MFNLWGGSINEVQRWLDDVLLGRNGILDEQSLFTVAHHCLSHFQADNDEPLSKIVWAECTMICFQILSIISSDHRKRYKQDEMHIRAQVLVKFGSQDKSLVLNKLVIEQWFLECLELDMHVVRDWSSQWQSLSKHQILQLRELKNRISIIESLIVAGFQFVNKDVYDWIDIKKTLP